MCNIWNFGGGGRMWMWERKQISFNSFEDTLELVKPAEKFDGFENQVISENQQCGSLEEVEDGAHGGGGGKQGVLHKEFQTPEENFLQKWKLKVRKKLIWTSRKDTKWRSILGGGGDGGISEVSWRSFCQSDVYENSQYFLTWQECDCVIYTHSGAKIWKKCKFCTECHKLWLKNMIIIK